MNMEKHASWISYTSNGMAVICGLTLNDWGMLVGILVGLATFGINWYYKAKEARRNGS